MTIIMNDYNDDDKDMALNPSSSIYQLSDLNLAKFWHDIKWGHMLALVIK